MSERDSGADSGRTIEGVCGRASVGGSRSESGSVCGSEGRIASGSWSGRAGWSATGGVVGSGSGSGSNSLGSRSKS